MEHINCSNSVGNFLTPFVYQEYRIFFLFLSFFFLADELEGKLDKDRGVFPSLSLLEKKNHTTTYTFSPLKLRIRNMVVKDQQRLKEQSKHQALILHNRLFHLYAENSYL